MPKRRNSYARKMMTAKERREIRKLSMKVRSKSAMGKKTISLSVALTRNVLRHRKDRMIFKRRLSIVLSKGTRLKFGPGSGRVRT